MSSLAETISRKLRNLAISNVIIGIGALVLTIYLTFIQDAAANAVLARQIVFFAAAAIVIITVISVLGIRRPALLHGMTADDEQFNERDTAKVLVPLAFADAGLIFVLVSLLLGIFVTGVIPQTPTSYLVAGILFATMMFLMVRVILMIGTKK